MTPSNSFILIHFLICKTDPFTTIHPKGPINKCPCSSSIPKRPSGGTSDLVEHRIRIREFIQIFHCRHSVSIREERLGEGEGEKDRPYGLLLFPYLISIHSPLCLCTFYSCFLDLSMFLSDLFST